MNKLVFNTCPKEGKLKHPPIWRSITTAIKTNTPFIFPKKLNSLNVCVAPINCNTL